MRTPDFMRVRPAIWVALSTLLLATALWSFVPIAVPAMASTTESATTATTSTQLTPAQLVEEYLAALGQAGAQITKTVVEPKALPITATLAQVKAIVDSLPKALAALNALTAPTTIPRNSGPSLQALGRPTPRPQTGLGCNGYGTPATGAHLVIGGTQYQNGFQLTNANVCSWQIGDKYTTFKAEVGPDLGYSCNDESVLRFLGQNGQRLPINSNGRIDEGIVIPTKGLVAISVDIAGESTVTVTIIRTFSYCSSIVDVVNDELS